MLKNSKNILLETDYTIFYIYDGINPIAEYSPNGSVLARYVYAGGLHIAKISGADTNFYHCDALGSPRTMTNESGAVTWTGAYYPFGEMIAGAGNVHGFTGKEYDSEMGLNYFCQRYYDPQIGRFITLDPFGGYIELPQSQNRYAYCMNNPLKYIDPLGLDAFPKLYPPEEQKDEQMEAQQPAPNIQFSPEWIEVITAGEILVGSGAMIGIGYKIIGVSLTGIPVSGGWSLLGLIPGIVFMAGGGLGIYSAFIILKPLIINEPPQPPNPEEWEQKTWKKKKGAGTRPYRKFNNFPDWWTPSDYDDWWNKLYEIYPFDPHYPSEPPEPPEPPYVPDPPGPPA